MISTSARPFPSFFGFLPRPLHQCRPDDDLITTMDRAGFSGIGVTVESASDRVLEGLGKGFTSEHVYKAAQVVGCHKLPCVWIFMMGGPNETRETVKETLRFAEKVIRPSDIVFFGLGIRIYPGTELDSIARRQGLLLLPSAGMLKPAEVVSRLKKDWIADIEAYDKGHTHMLMFADMLTDGSVKQFPEKFKK